MSELFPGFTTRPVATAGARIHCEVGGSGPPLLLLHGYPQTHAMWHRIAPRLAERYTVVCSDLRGYGDSSKPDGGEGHVAYSKREMAKDQVEAMQALGFARFKLVGHDRGGRVAHRLCLDHPQAVERVAVLVGPQVEHHAALATVVEIERRVLRLRGARGQREHRAHRIAGRRLDLDDLGAPVAQDAAGRWSGDPHAELDDAVASQWLLVRHAGIFAQNRIRLKA